MTPLSNMTLFEKRPKPAALLYLIFITILLLMICLVILAIVVVLGRAEVLPVESSSSKLFVQPTNASPVFFDTKDTVDAENLLMDIESTTTLDSKKSIAEDFSTSQRSAPKTTTGTSTISFNISAATDSIKTEHHLLDTTTRKILIHEDSNGNMSLSTSISTSKLSSRLTFTSTTTTTAKKSTTTNSTTNSIAPTSTTMMTTPGHRNNSLSKAKTFAGKYSNQRSFEPITAVRIDFENPILEFNNSELQEEYNMTSPTSSLSGHEDSEVLSLLITDADSSMPSPLDNRLRHKMLEELTPQCVKKKAHKCRPSVRRNILSREDIPSEEMAAELGHFGGIRAIHYTLNLTINRDMHTSYQGTVEIMMKVIENTSTIFVHVGTPIAGIDLAQIQLWDCHRGNALCISSMVQHLNDELLSIDLIESIFIGQIIILRISNFGSPRSSSGLLVQNPHKWEPKRPWTVTTLFQMRDARSIMPCLDLPSMKATLDLCVIHPLGSEARSNTPLRKNVIDGTITSCFERTPPMSTYLYAITVFNRMHNIHQAADHKLHLPELEIFYPEQMSAEKPIWMKMETIQALLFMRNFTGFEYPLKKLSLIATSLPINGVENFGLITLNERWMAYPKYRMAHSILAHEIVHQWIGNVVTVTKWNEICLQEGLTTYLEWILTAELSNSTINLVEVLQEKRIEAISRDTKSNASIISDFRTFEDIYRCFDKPAIFFVMLESGFGAGVIAKLTRLLMEEYAYGNAGVQEWRQLIIEAANNPLAGKFFEDYFTQPGFPLVRVAYTSNGLNLKQETMIAAKKANTSSLVIPLELSIDTSKVRMKILFNESEQLFPLNHHGIVVVDPDRTTYAVVVYEAEIYIRLLKCAQSDSCAQIDALRMRYIVEDFCWTFLNDHIIINERKRETLNVWIEFMHLISATNYTRGTCACCMNKNLSKSFNIPCKWHWKDRCEHIKLVKQIYSL